MTYNEVKIKYNALVDKTNCVIERQIDGSYAIKTVNYKQVIK